MNLRFHMIDNLFLFSVTFLFDCSITNVISAHQYNFYVTEYKYLQSRTKATII